MSAITKYESQWIETGDQTWKIRHRLMTKIGQEGRYLFDGNVAYVEIECKKAGDKDWKKDINEGIAQSIVWQSGLYQKLAIEPMTPQNLNRGNSILAKAIQTLVNGGYANLLVIGKEGEYKNLPLPDLSSLDGFVTEERIPSLMDKPVQRCDLWDIYSDAGPVGPQGPMGVQGPSSINEKVEPGQTWSNVAAPDFIASVSTWKIKVLEPSLDDGPGWFFVEHEPDSLCQNRVRYVASESVIKQGRRVHGY